VLTICQVEGIAAGRGPRDVQLRPSQHALRQSVTPIIQVWEIHLPILGDPPSAIGERLSRLKEVLERRTERSALLLRNFLGPIRLEPTQGDIGRPYYLARTTINILAIMEPPPREGGGSDDGSNSLRWWRRRESNPVGA